MSGIAKFGFLILAVVSMTGLAVASVFMAQNRFFIATIVFLISFLLIGYGFRMRRRIMRETQSQPR